MDIDEKIRHPKLYMNTQLYNNFFKCRLTDVHTWEDKHPTDDLPIEKENVSNSVASQTCGPWQKKIRSKERVYSELLDFIAHKISILKRRRRILFRKGNLKGE